MKANCVLALGLGMALIAPSLRAKVSLTVYQRNLVLVRDTRTVDLDRGENRVVFDKVAPGIYESSLRIVPLDKSADVKTIEVSYEYDLADRDRIWRKYLNKPFEFTKDDSLYKGRLLSFDDDLVYLEPEGQPGAVALIERSGIKDMTFEALPEGLVLHPEIVWKVKSGKKHQNVKAEISYLSDGMTWQADYAAHLLADDRIRLLGSLTLTNSLDLDFEDARVDLIAGDPHRAYDSKTLYGGDEFSAPFEEKKDGARFFEYRQYKLPEPASLHASQTKNVPLIGPAEVVSEKGFLYDGSAGDEEVLIRLAFENKVSSGLGVALPEGDLLLYQVDDSGLIQFLGEDRLEASSPGDKVELIIGKAFDLRVDRKRISHQRISRNRTRDTVEIVLGSSREKSSKITVRERLYGFWEIVEATWAGQPIGHRVEDANKIEFDVELAASKSDTLRYVVEYGY